MALTGAGEARRAGPSRMGSSRMGPREARIQRLMARFVGGGFVVYLMVSATEFEMTARLVDGWFTPVAALCAFTPGMVLFAYSFRAQLDQRVLSLLALGCSLGYLAASGAWLLAWTGATGDVDRILWLASFPGLAPLAIALVRPLAEGAAHLTVLTTVAMIEVNLARGMDDFLAVTTMQVIWSFTYSSLFLLGVAMTRRTGRTLDDTRRTALDAASASAATSAREVERARFDALVHDHVIATLLAADSDAPDRRLAEQARFALAELDALAQSPESGPISRDEAAARLRVTVAATGDDIEVRIADAGGRRSDGPAGDDRRQYPIEAVSAIAEALAEAVRNSRRHGGPGTRCVVLIEFGPEHLRVTQIDDGVGFDLDEVPPERLGIEVSIRLRMASVLGGGARLRSDIGVGTTVQLWWVR